MSRRAIHSFRGAKGDNGTSRCGRRRCLATKAAATLAPPSGPCQSTSNGGLAPLAGAPGTSSLWGSSQQSTHLVLPRRRKELHVELDDSIGHDNPYAPPKATAGTIQQSRLATDGIDLSRENPFLTIWTRPRATIRGIVDTDPSLHVTPLAMIGGVLQALNRASMRNAGDQLSTPTILIGALVGGSIGGLLGLYVGGWFLRITGRWLGGQAEPEQVRSAIAWSGVPVLATIPIWVIGIALIRLGPVQKPDTKSRPTTRAMDRLDRERLDRVCLWDLVIRDPRQVPCGGSAILGLESPWLDFPGWPGDRGPRGDDHLNRAGGAELSRRARPCSLAEPSRRTARRSRARAREPTRGA